MLKISRMADYAVVVLSQLVRRPDAVKTARGLAGETGIPEAAVAKLLNLLSREGVLTAHRGAHGGYSVGRPAAQITVADIIAAVDGPLALTSCVDGSTAERCGVESLCPLKGHWNAVNRAVAGVLEEITLEALLQPPGAAPPMPAPRKAAGAVVQRIGA